MLWYMSIKKTSDGRAQLFHFDSEDAALTEKARILAEDDPDAEIGDPFEEADTYQLAQPRIQARRVVDPAGTEVDVWDDGVTTPRS